MTTTPVRDCPDHNDPIECSCQAARGQADALEDYERRHTAAAAKARTELRAAELRRMAAAARPDNTEGA